MGKHRRIEDYVIPDPWTVRVREWLVKNTVCRIVGHKRVRKFDGVIYCRRHD